jgi:hypothetical protein
MPPTYSSKETKVERAELDDRALIAIGRLIRAAAEIEDLVNLFICNLAEINESRMVVMLGRSAISKRVEIAEYLAKLNSPQAAGLAARMFTDGFWDMTRCRNDVAHGVLLGRNEDGAWSFLTAKTEQPTGASAIQIVASYTTDYLEDLAEAAENSIPTIAEGLKLTVLREARYGRPLSPHRKGLRQQKKGAKP